MTFKPGDLVSRGFSSRGGVTQGATYIVSEVSADGSRIRVQGDDRWYEAWKFAIVGPYDH